MDYEYLFVYSLAARPEYLDRCKLEVDDFEDARSRLIFGVINDMATEKQQIDIVAVGVMLSEKGYEQYKDFFHYTEEILSVPAMEATEVLIKKASTLKKMRLIAQQEDDPKKVLASIEELVIQAVENPVLNTDKAFEEWKEQFLARKALADEGGTPGIPTGFRKLDQLAPPELGTMTVLMARPSVGKSALALDIAYYAASVGKNVLFISAEMTIHRLMDRLLSKMVNTPSQSFRKGAGSEHLEALGHGIDFLGNGLNFVFLAAGTSKDCQKIVAKEDAKKKLDLVIVDYMQYLGDKTTKGASSNDRVAGISRNLKQIAGKHNVAVIALSQVNREAVREPGGRPKLHHLRDSGAIEQDADIVLILNREERSSTVATLDVAKNRDGEVDAEIILNYIPHTTTFKEPPHTRSFDSSR